MIENGRQESDREAPGVENKGQQLADELKGMIEAAPRPQDSIDSFVTSKGSVYTYDKEGHTARYKTAKSEQQPTQGIAVFVELGLRDAKEVVAAYLTRSSNQRTRIFVVEHGANGQTRIITDATEIQDPSRLSLAIYQGDHIAKSRPVSLFPKIGSYVFDTRQYEQDGVQKTERHLGHKVTAINFKKPV